MFHHALYDDDTIGFHAIGAPTTGGWLHKHGHAGSKSGSKTRSRVGQQNGILAPSRNGTITSGFRKDLFPMKEADVIFQENARRQAGMRLSSVDMQIVFDAANAGS